MKALKPQHAYRNVYSARKIFRLNARPTRATRIIAIVRWFNYNTIFGEAHEMETIAWKQHRKLEIDQI